MGHFHTILTWSEELYLSGNTSVEAKIFKNNVSVFDYASKKLLFLAPMYALD